METISVHNMFVIGHLFGVILGAGGAFISDGVFFSSLKDKIISKDEFRSLRTASYFIWLGIGILFISGIGLFVLNAEVLSTSEKFISKMTVVGIIILNGIIFHTIHLSFLKRHLGKVLATKKQPTNAPLVPFILASGVVSMVSWVSTVILGGLRKVWFSYGEFLTLYFICIACGIYASHFLFRRYISKTNKKRVILLGTIALVIALISAMVTFDTGGYAFTPIMHTQDTNGSY